MAHDHGNEYQVRFAHEDGTEALSQWVSREGIAQAMAALHGPGAKAYWLRERKVLCPNCLDPEQGILEYPLVDIPSRRLEVPEPRWPPSRGASIQRW
jgi:hypothetical protein